MASPPGTYIFTGQWINWSRGHVLGSTLTLSQRDGGLLIAFLGVLVTVAGASCWRVLSFLIHQYRAKESPQHAVHHQQQVLLRNCTSPGGAAWQMTQMAWAWRKIAKHSVLSNLPLISIAVVNTVLFGVAGVFSSQVTQAAGDETLLMGPNCGFVIDRDLQPGLLQPDWFGFQSQEANETLAASSYSRSCYGDDQDELRCNRFVKPKLSSMSRANASCPFVAELCSKLSQSFETDSGLIDSHEDLGINSQPSKRVQMRRVSTCAVLQTKDYAFQVNTTDSGGDPRRMVYYTYGSMKRDNLLDGETENTTFRYNLNDQVGQSGYSLTPFIHVANTSTGWDPIPELKREDADTIIMFLAQNTVSYLSPVLDPWFNATDQQYLDRETPTYFSSFTVNVLACTDRYQYCNPSNQRCTALTGSRLVDSGLAALGLNTAQEEIASSLYYSILWWSTYSAVHHRGANALLAASEILGGSDQLSPGLPPDQWTREIAEWFHMGLARLQQQMLDHATGPAHLYEGLELVPGPASVCGSQKVRSPSGYVSFSVVGVAVVLALAGLLIVAGYTLDTLAGAVMRRRRWKDHKRLQWALDEKLQLQRLAYEGAGQGRWAGGADAVPVTARGDTLRIGAVVDPAHPRLETGASCLTAKRAGDALCIEGALSKDEPHGAADAILMEPKHI